MKTTFSLITFGCWLALSALAQEKEISRLEIGERGDHHRVWQRVTAEVDEAGETTYRTNAAYTELETGMNVRQPDGSFVEASNEIEITGTGGLAQGTRHHVSFAGNCNSPVAIDMTTPDGKRLQSRILGLSYFDTASGKSVLIAEIKDSDGQLLMDSKNEVMYVDAFTDFQASVHFRNGKAGLQQNIIFQENPPSPADYNLNPATTRLQVLTEFFNPPMPAKRAQLTDGVVDEFLDFGDYKMGRGWVYVTGAEQTKIPVTKQWRTLDGRIFLIEEIPYPMVETKLKALPPRTASLDISPNGVRHQVSVRRLLPPVKQAGQTSSSMRLASASLRVQGVVLDYSLVSGGTDYVFKGDSTYYVNGETKFTGEVIIEGGTVIKFSSTNYSALWVDGGSVNCQTAPYRPAIFTSRNDNTVGETIAGSTGSPAIDTQGNYYLMISSTNQTTLQYLRMSYCYCGVTAINGGLNLSHVQFVHSDYPVYLVSTTQCSVRNALMYDVTQLAFEVFNALVTVEHLTLDGCPQLGGNDWGATMTLTNSLLVDVSSLGNIPITTNAVVVTSGTVFQTVGAASHYLADNTYRNAGTTNINASLAADLRKLTTYPPIELTSNFTVDTTLAPQAQRDTDLPDLGYHYDPLDYVVSGRTLTKTLWLTNGVALGTYGNSGSHGLSIGAGGKVISEGSPTGLNWVARYNSVQEQATTNWSATSVAPSLLVGDATAQGQFRFTGWSILGGVGDHFNGTYTMTSRSFFTDCQLGGGSFTAYPCALGLTNSLWERVNVTLYDTTELTDYYLYNNLFRGGAFTYRILNSPTGYQIAKDNLFDQTTISKGPTGADFTHGHNGYVTNASRLTPNGTGDKILTNGPIYLTSTLGRYYYPTNGGLLSVLLDVGSRNATNAGLYHYTVATNQVKETTSTVDIGFHFVAVNSSGLPIDTDSDGGPDHWEDRNGNGSVDAGETDWTTYNSPNGLTGGGGLHVFTPLK